MSNAKIIVDYLDKNGSLSREIVWGKKFENDKYYIKNIPFFAPNILMCAELAGDFHLGDSRQLTDKSLLPFDLVS
ncbi:hypothetical protein AhaeINNSZ174_08170 [Acinetobacter haemolyticus]|uniref:hypothetical protein n=1 Tax=Acinetobacter haemolyticus TaxID=29430 RepID=UPI001331F625|nr:hypothetical protein [Acinetobacter haemolyticus]QHI29431.1 hypothetical protein AhaeINNSZ174_08170 [Acinetobacter haemolyticus]